MSSLLNRISSTPSHSSSMSGLERRQVVCCHVILVTSLKADAHRFCKFLLDDLIYLQLEALSFATSMKSIKLVLSKVASSC
jgi:hypothetical protein